VRASASAVARPSPALASVTMQHLPPSFWRAHSAISLHLWGSTRCAARIESSGDLDSNATTTTVRRCARVLVVRRYPRIAVFHGFRFATDICNIQDPLFTGLFRMMQNLPFVKRKEFI
jgi:hypothetical protein